eukprot:765504-Hanusia_phi.AAC.10
MYPSAESANEISLHASEHDKDEKEHLRERSLRQSSIATAQQNLQTIQKIQDMLRWADNEIEPFAVVEEVMHALEVRSDESLAFCRSCPRLLRRKEA